MQTRRRIRKRLVAAYESLPAIERILVQLCSVIYEPTTVSAILRCMLKIGVRHPDEKAARSRAITYSLDRLQSWKLLNGSFRCHEALVEIATRDAVAAGSVYRLEESLGSIESPLAWSTVRASDVLCLSCRKPPAGPAFEFPVGLLCVSCTEAELRSVVSRMDLSSWPVARFKKALSPGGDLVSRLAVLWRFGEALKITANKDSPSRQDLLELLADNIGRDEPSPLTAVAHRAALEACSAAGKEVVPLLFEMSRGADPLLYARVITALGVVDPENRQVQRVLEEASRNSNPEMRKAVVRVVAERESSWTMRMFLRLNRDPDASVRRLLQEVPESWKSKKRKSSRNKPGKPPTFDLYRLMVETVREEMPSLNPFRRGVKEYCPRLMRDLRIGIYTDDLDLYGTSYKQISYYCSKLYNQPDPLLQVCNNPFDAEWFRTLHPQLQLVALQKTFYHAMTVVDCDEEQLDYAVSHDLQSSVSVQEKYWFDFHLISRLVVGGRLKEARELIQQSRDRSFTGGLSGWVSFIEGKNKEAIDSFEADLKELRKRTRQKAAYFKALPGLFFILALLKLQDNSILQRISQLIDSALSEHHEHDFFAKCYSFLKAVAHIQGCEIEEARSIISRNDDNQDSFSILFSAMAQYWLDGALNQEKIDALSQLFINARAIRLDWIAMECAELLCRTEQDTPIRRNFIQQVQTESGMQSFVPFIPFEEPWRKCLRALKQTAVPGQESSPEAASGKRLVWLVGFRGKSIDIQPKEQRLSPKGTWSKGRPVALSRLFGNRKPEYLSSQDRAICSAIERRFSSSYGGEFYFDQEKTLLAMVGHPLLFLEESPSVSVEVVKGEAEILVTRANSGFNIRFSLEATDDRVVLVREGPTRLKVVELSEKHRQIARILGPKGLNVPESAREEVLSAITGISSLVTVHSAIGGTSKDIVLIEGDSTPHVHLMPFGSGLKIEMFVKPFVETGPYLKPGLGAENLIAEIGGKRVQARRDLGLEEKRAAMVEAGCPALAGFEETARQWIFREPEGCLQVLLDLKALQERGEVVVEWPEGERIRVTREVSFDRLHLRIRGKTDWFEMAGHLDVDDKIVLDMKQLLDLVGSTDNRFIPLGEGQFLTLTRELRKRLEELELFAEKRSREIRLHPLAAMAIKDITADLPHLDVDDSWKSRMEAVRTSRLIAPEPPSTLKAQLRDYQVEGYRWLARLAHLGVGGCLADDMGLGKTLQALAILLDRAQAGPALVVAPTSVCMNWLVEANRFAPTLNMVSFGGNNRENLVKDLKAFDVLVSSYGLMQQEAELLGSVNWNTIVLDEAQAIKNVMTKRSQAAMKLKGAFKIITTGTPIENHLGEFWTLFSFINPGLLGSRKRFDERFAVPIERHNDREAKRRLKKLIQPFILRRSKSEVLEELPPRTEVVLRVVMGDEETAFYEALRRGAIEKLDRSRIPAAQKHLQILAEIMKLRRACCHPRLVLPESGLPSSKLHLFGEVISELLEYDHKVLVFSQFVGYLKLIREYLDHRRIRYRYLDGSTLPRDRKREVEAFQAGDGDLFLISLKAGGLGLNLTAADYVVHMDPWWNPAVEDQASDRAHRIGQQRPVTVYRLVTQNTIEEKIMKLHQEKRDLASSLLEGSDISGKISAEELLQLIRDA